MFCILPFWALGFGGPVGSRGLGSAGRKHREGSWLLTFPFQAQGPPAFGRAGPGNVYGARTPSQSVYGITRGPRRTRSPKSDMDFKALRFCELCLSLFLSPMGTLCTCPLSPHQPALQEDAHDPIRGGRRSNSRASRACGGSCSPVLRSQQGHT